MVEEVFDLLDELDDRRDAKVEDLSGGQAKMVAIGRALALRPDLLILDEPLEGLAPVVVEKLKGYIRDINDRGIAVLVAESNVTHVPEVVDRLAVIERGGDSRPRRPRRGRAGRGDRAADAGQRRGVTATEASGRRRFTDACRRSSSLFQRSSSRSVHINLRILGGGDPPVNHV